MRRAGQEFNILSISPKAWGSPASKLADVILSGHRDADLDQWHARVVVGRPGNFAFVQGPALEGGVAGRRATGPGHIVFGREGNMYAACDTFIQVVGHDGTARVLAGTPGIGGCTDGPAAKATFAGARDLAMDKDGAIYVVDEVNQVLRNASHGPVHVDGGNVPCALAAGARWGSRGAKPLPGNSAARGGLRIRREA